MPVYSISVASRSTESFKLMRATPIPKHCMALIVRVHRESYRLTSIIDGPGSTGDIIIEGSKIFDFFSHPEESSIPSIILRFRDSHNLTPIIDSRTPAVLTAQGSQVDVVVSNVLCI
jgi:hypothetical protein